MLKYFKRQKGQRSKDKDIDVAANAEKRHSLLSTSSFCDEILEEDNESLSFDANSEEDIFEYHSRLSMSLPSIVKDADCLSYFVQYLEAKNALPLIKFYLDTENFKIAALGQLEKQQQDAALLHNSMHNGSAAEIENEALYDDIEEEQERRPDGDGEEEESAQIVPELKTLCDLSMHKPLTDDEKSQIYAETNKQITKCTTAIGSNAALAQKLKACSELSLYSEQSDDMHNLSRCISAASIKDALAIYQKYLAANAQLFVELPVTILSNISLLLCKRQDDSLVPISADCFDEAQQHVLDELERQYLIDFLQSPLYCKYCIELIQDELPSAEQLNIYDILYSEVALFFFMEYLEQQGERECLDFWTAAINFRKSYANLNADTTEIQSDAMIIYKKFFSLQSDGRLWLSHKLRCRVESAICAQPNEVVNSFDLALMVTAKYLEKKYFSAFIKSELFAQYVSELKAKIQEAHNNSADGNVDGIDTDELDAVAPESGLQHRLSFKSARKHMLFTPTIKRRHRKTLSDCTSETSRSGGELFKHISQHNTLLAMDTSTMNFKHLQSATMSIDERQLKNPNLLWHRNNSVYESGTSGESSTRGLKFGRVNSLGRYERDFETIESFNNYTSKYNWSIGVSGSKLKNAMRKLVNLPEHKAQEEIAWQIAEMIVKDVTDVTLNNAPNVKKKNTSPVANGDIQSL